MARQLPKVNILWSDLQVHHLLASSPDVEFLLSSRKLKETTTRYSPEPLILSLFQHTKVLIFWIFKSSRTVLNSYKTHMEIWGEWLWVDMARSDEVYFVFQLFVFSISVKLKPTCTPKAFTGAQLKSNKGSLRAYTTILRLWWVNSWARDVQGCELGISPGHCGALHEG